MIVLRWVLLGAAIVAGVAWLGLPFAAGLASGFLYAIAERVVRDRRKR